MSTVSPAIAAASTADLRQAVAAALPELIALRRHLHAHPELSGNEHQTAALVAGELRRFGWRVREGVGRTGVRRAKTTELPSRVGLKAHTACSEKASVMWRRLRS